jgi:hypothetical protein
VVSRERSRRGEHELELVEVEPFHGRAVRVSDDGPYELKRATVTS